MSIHYCIKESEAIPVDQLLAGLASYGIYDAESANGDATHHCVTDGTQYLWCYGDPLRPSAPVSGQGSSCKRLRTNSKSKS
jgi:hypothetical protein